MTDLQTQLDQIQQLDQQATPGPWVSDKSHLYDHVEPHPYDLYEAGEDDPPLASDILPHNAEFIALARTFAPAASRALRAVTQECERLKAVSRNTVHEDSPARHIIRATAIRQAADSVLEVLTEVMEAEND